MNYWSLMEEEGSMLFVMPNIAQSGDATVRLIVPRKHRSGDNLDLDGET